MSNRYPSTCNRCETYVPARAGTLSRAGSRWNVTCPDCTAGAADEPSEALAWSRGDSVSYGVVTSSGWRGIRNRRGRCEDAPCCGCCTF
jgi:hypothetical protein